MFERQRVVDLALKLKSFNDTLAELGRQEVATTAKVGTDSGTIPAAMFVSTRMVVSELVDALNAVGTTLLEMLNDSEEAKSLGIDE